MHGQSRRKSGMGRRAAIKRSTLKGYLGACRQGQRFITPRKARQYVPANGGAVEHPNPNPHKLLQRAMADARRWQATLHPSRRIKAQ